MSKRQTILASMLALVSSGMFPGSISPYNIHRVKPAKRVVSEKETKPGRNHPAKNYDPISKTWR